MKVLFIDACPRSRDLSRSYRLGRTFLDEYLRLHDKTELIEYRLDDMDLAPLTGSAERLRSETPLEAKLADPAYLPAREFASADLIVICAPYWDFAFPASLKVFIENVCVYDITFRYDSDLPVGLCRAAHLVYLTTAGSPVGEDNWGGRYLEAVTGKLLGVRTFHQITADGLNLSGADVNAIMHTACEQAKALAADL